MNQYYLKNVLRYGFRYLFRDNDCVMGRKWNELQKNMTLSSSSLSTLSSEMVLQTLRCAVKNIPFYSNFEKIVSQANVDDAIKVLQQFPVITKNELLQNKNTLYPNAGKIKPWWSVGKTSGTTGTPLEVYRNYSSVLHENAFIRRHWQWSGFNKKRKRATLRGDLIAPINNSKPPFWFYNFFDNQLLLSSRHLQKEYLPLLAYKLEEFSPIILEAYPSAAYELAKHLKREKRVIKIPYVYTGSEILYEHQRELIEESFNTCVMDFYGMAERVAFANECALGNLHLGIDYSYVEILDENNNPTDDYGFLTGTTFHNTAMPLIRYKLSDMTKFKQGQCTCGCPFRMIEPIKGKFEDVLYGGIGHPVSPSVLTFALKGLSNINKSQIAQVGEKSWEVRIVPEENYTDKESDKIIYNIRTLVDSSVEIVVKKVEDISRTSAGKYRWVVNEWQKKQGSNE